MYKNKQNFKIIFQNQNKLYKISNNRDMLIKQK